MLLSSIDTDNHINHGANENNHNKNKLTDFMLFLASFTNIHAQNGPDGGRAALFITYAKKAKKAIRAQDALLAVNLTGHKYLRRRLRK